MISTTCRATAVSASGAPPTMAAAGAMPMARQASATRARDRALRLRMRELVARDRRAGTLPFRVETKAQYSATLSRIEHGFLIGSAGDSSCLQSQGTRGSGTEVKASFIAGVPLLLLE